MKSFVSLEEAIDVLNFNIECMDVEKVHILEGMGKICVNDVYSTMNNPPFNKSAMDGYAIRVDESEGNNIGEVNDKYKVVGVVYAGDVFNGVLGKGECVKIMTGAKIPNKLNVVVKKEDVVEFDDYIIVNKNVKINENVCFEGEDISKNQLLIEARKKLNYADIGILASSGIEEVLVYKKPRIGFISTGDEVVDINRYLEEGKIYNSNKYSILARLYELGYICECTYHVNDDIKDIEEKIIELSKKVDFIITTGSVSVGDKDILDKAIIGIDGNILFRKIDIKPGSSMLASKYNGVVIIGLSGNPNAALTTFELLAKPSLEKLSGAKNISINKEKAITLDKISNKNNKRRFTRGKLVVENGIQYVSLTQIKSGNGILSSNLSSDCLIEIKKECDVLSGGELVDIIRL